MIVEVVLGEVGKHGTGEVAASHPLLIKSMGAHLHGTDLGTGLNGLGQLGLEQIGEGRGVLGRHAVAWPAVHQGAKQGRRPA